MRRREFITGLCGAATASAWPFAARAQQRAMPVVGYLTVGDDVYLAALRQGMAETGFVEGRNVAIEYRSAQGQYDRLPALAKDFVKRGVAVIFASGGPNAVQAAKAATATVPIVFSNGVDPVKLGLVTSLNHPGGNVTGVSFFNSPLGPKRLELMHELIPAATLVALLVNPNNASTQAFADDVLAAAGQLGLTTLVSHAGSVLEIDAAIATIARQHAAAIFVGPDAFFNGRREQIVATALQYSIPTIFSSREPVEAGALMSYAPSVTESYRQAGIYIGRILKGAKPADLPVLLPTKFELVVNLKTAKALGLTISESFLLRADDVIE